MASLKVQFLVFAAVGAVGTLAHYTVLVALVHFAGTDAAHASAAGFVAGAAVNYALNYSVTFRSRAPHLRAIPRFMLIAVVGLCLNTAIVALGVGALDLHYLLAQMVATGLVLIWNFVANRAITFGESTHGSRRHRHRTY
jgi:putative flippase GtrA